MDASQIVSSNKMSGKFTVIGSGYSEVLSEILIRQGNNDDVLTEIAIRVEEENILNAEIDVAYGNISDVLTEIQPYGWKAVPVEIEVRPHSRMKALYEIQEPPKITDILHPVKDAFTREKSVYQTLNYGDTASLNVGSTSDDRFRSYLQFDFSNWNPFFVIIESKIRLHYSGTVPNGVNIELLTLNQLWQEYGVTHVNRPNPISLATTKFINNSVEKYIEFEVTKLTEDWIRNVISNEGLVLRYANESDSSFGYINFKSRESSRPPELLITYYDGRIYSGGRSQVPTEIFVWQTGNKDVLTQIEVAYSNKSDDILVELEVHRYESPVIEELETEITVTKPNIWSEITISVIDDDSILVEITPRLPLESIQLAEITVSKPYQFVEIEVKYKNNVETVIEIQRYDDDVKLAEISVTREHLNTEIYVRYRNDIPTVIEVERGIENDKLAEISISREMVYAEIYVRPWNDVYVELEVERGLENDKLVEVSASREKVPTEIEIRAITEDTIDTELEVRALADDTVPVQISVTRESLLTELEIRAIDQDTVDTEISVRVPDDDDIVVQVSVTREIVLTEIEIRGIGEDEIETEILIRALGDDSVDTTISISRPDTLTEITVTEYRDIEAAVEVKYRDDVETEITIMIHNSILVEIEAIPNSNVEVEISISRPNILTEIHIPYFGDSDVMVEILPRILRASDVDTVIQVRGKGGSYAFII